MYQYHVITREELSGFQARKIMASTSTKKLEVIYDFDTKTTHFETVDRIGISLGTPDSLRIFIDVDRAIESYNSMR